MTLFVLVIRAVPDAGRLVGLHARAADLRVQQAADRERVVADEFRVEANARAAGEKPVVRIAFQLLQFPSFL